MQRYEEHRRGESTKTAEATGGNWRRDQPKSYLSYTYPDIVSRCKRKGKENRADAAVGVRLYEADDHLLLIWPFWRYVDRSFAIETVFRKVPYRRFTSRTHSILKALCGYAFGPRSVCAMHWLQIGAASILRSHLHLSAETLRNDPHGQSLAQH